MGAVRGGAAAAAAGLTALLALQQGGAAEAAPACVTPAALDLKVGKIDGEQGLHSLQKRDLSGSQDRWSAYIEASIAKGDFDAELTFELPDDINPNQPVRITTTVNFQGEKGSQQQWGLQASDDDLVFWDNSGVTRGWRWALTSNMVRVDKLAPYLSNGNSKLKASLRPTAGPVSYNALFDYVEICFENQVATAPPSVAPAPLSDDEACGSVASIDSLRGSYIGTAEALTGLELEGDATTSLNAVRFVPDVAKGGNFELSVPLTGASSDADSMRFAWNYRYTVAKQTAWQMQIRNQRRRKWEPLTKHASSSSGNTWTQEQYSWDVAALADYLNNQGDVDLRLLTKDKGTSALPFSVDMIAVCAAGGQVSGGQSGSTNEGPSLGTCPAPPNNEISSWAYQALICGAYIDEEENVSDYRSQVNSRARQGCNVLLLDSMLSSYYVDDDTFFAQINKIDQFTKLAHDAGMKVVVYYPLLELVTKNGRKDPNSAAKQHRDWLQVSLDGIYNVFSGQEHWVGKNDESAWFDPEAEGFRDFLMNRVLALADTSADGLWGDVPIYSDTVGSWMGGSENSAKAFKEWTKDQGICSKGCDLPKPPKYWMGEDERFKEWLVWRHHSLGRFLERIRAKLHDKREGFYFIVENYATDYDIMVSGLDGATYSKMTGPGLFTVWEIDSVSNNRGMQYATLEDFRNQLTMRKFGRAVDRDSPSWAFSYGNEPLDAAMVLSGAFATGTNPMESKTPLIDSTADAQFRTAWFEWAAKHTCQLFQTPRFADAGLVFSSSSRDLLDSYTGCGYGMFTQWKKPRKPKMQWWAEADYDSAVACEHFGGYRGASHFLQETNTPFRVVLEVGLEAADLQGLRFLWLHSTSYFNPDSAKVIVDWVRAGGFLLITGRPPAMYDHLSRSVAKSMFAPLIGGKAFEAGKSTNAVYGKGHVLYRGDLDARDLFPSSTSAAKHAETKAALKQVVGIHVPQRFFLSDGEKMHIELSEVVGNTQSMYIVNGAGMQVPVKSAPTTTNVWIKAPDGKRVAKASAYSPNSWKAATLGPLTVTEYQDGWSVIAGITIDQFTMITFVYEAGSGASSFGPLPEAGPARYLSKAHESAAEDGHDFIINKMRNPKKQAPYRYGVFTNYIDTDEREELYADGHHMTSEHIGTLLRASACMREKQTWEESYEFVRDAMVSPLFHVLNWAIDKDLDQPYLQPFGQRQWAATAPLDDLRTIMGMMEGANAWGVQEAADLAVESLRAIYHTAIVRSAKGYPGGLLAFSFDFVEVEDPSLKPPAEPLGLGETNSELIPVDYQDLEALHFAALHLPQFIPVLRTATQLLLDAEIRGVPGLFYNGYEPTKGKWTGDFENQGDTQGKHLKTIQELWTAIHLARVATAEPSMLTSEQRAAAAAAAGRSFAFFKAFYDKNGRIPEYLTTTGGDVPNCPGRNCLDRRQRNIENEFEGSGRIYALFVRLGHYLGADASYLEAVADRMMLDDRITSGKLAGMFGAKTAGAGNSDAWNTLESILSLCILGSAN